MAVGLRVRWEEMNLRQSEWVKRWNPIIIFRGKNLMNQG
jgi:hypothetical protein